MYYDASKIQQKALALIDRHLDQLLQDDKVALATATTIQNYAKALAVLAKDQRDASKGFNPAEMSDEELDRLAIQAREILNESDNSENEETDLDSGTE
jgi:hypothetical protein